VIGLNVRDEAALDTLIASQNDPTSPNYHKYLTPQEFTRRFSPAWADVNKVVAYLKRNGLTIADISDNRMLITVRGTAAQVESAFDVSLNVYSLNAEQHISNDRDPSMPRELQQIVRSVMGLSDFAEFHSKMKPSAKASSGSPQGFGADDIAKAYDFPNQNNPKAKTKYSGKGVTIGIATVYSYNRSDAEAYWHQYGIRRTGATTYVRVHGTSNKLDGETTLDLEQAGAQAPGADIIMYLAKNPSLSTFAIMFNQIVSEDRVDIVSISWGLCEANTGKSQMHSEHLSFKQGAAQGMAFFAAAGDDGAYDCDKSKSPAVDFPSSDPYVTAVGGTSLRVHSDGSRKSESAWTGAGGGTSTEFPRPAWQTTGNGLPDGDKRETSDISLNADPWTGYSTYFKNAWDQAGGTSFAAPATAGLWALVEESIGAKRALPNPVLYRIGNSPEYGTVFNDVTTGDNGNHVGPGFAAGTGWDHPTGWGTPNGEALIDWVQKNEPGFVPPPKRPAQAPLIPTPPLIPVVLPRRKD
jgi:kumamolisin